MFVCKCIEYNFAYVTLCSQYTYRNSLTRLKDTDWQETTMGLSRDGRLPKHLSRLVNS